MNKYFVDFEFNTLEGNRYWFPLIINLQTRKEAEIATLQFETALREHFQNVRMGHLIFFIEEIHTEFISELTRLRSRGQIQILNVNIWNFKTIQNIPELNFTEHLNLIDYTDVSIDTDIIVKTIARLTIPVRMINRINSNEFEDFLLINVVQ